MAPEQAQGGANGEVILSVRLVVTDAQETAAAGLADVCSKILAHRVARSKAELVGDADPDLLGGLALRFADPVSAVACVLRYLADIEKMRGGGRPQPSTGRKFSHYFGIARDDGKRAQALRDATAADAIGVTLDIWAVVEGKLDVEARAADGDADADAVTLVPTKIGTTFRYMPWSTPGRRRLGLILAALLVVATMVGLSIFGPPPK